MAKYRIVKDGDGFYYAQQKGWFFWSFVIDTGSWAGAVDVEKKLNLKIKRPSFSVIKELEL